MRVMFSMTALPLAAFLGYSSVSLAQPALTLPGCEAAPEVRKVMDEKLDYNALDKMKSAERWQFRRKVLEDLIAKYPRELEPYESLLRYARQDAPDEYPAVRERFIKMAKDHPDDPLALLLSGKALVGKDTAEAIRELELAKAKAPDSPWPTMALASVYFNGKRADKQKLVENLDAFFVACPASTEGQWLLNKDQPQQPKVAVALRAHLEKETDPKKLEDFQTLWGLEFRTRPPAEHDAVRAQVAQDLKRLESLNPHGDAEWQQFLIAGYKESGADEATVKAREDRLMTEFPRSDEASRIASDRWEKAHPKPEDQTDTAAWTKYHELYKAALKGWIHDYSDSTFYQRYAWFYAIFDDDTITQQDGIATLDAYLKSGEDYEPASELYEVYENAAVFLLQHHWQPQRALSLLDTAHDPFEKELARTLENDNLSDEERNDAVDRQVYDEEKWTGLVLKAALQAAAPGQALKLQAQIEAPAPSEKKRLSAYWWNRARFEVVRDHKQDALAYFQLALQTRLSAPKSYEGKLEDDLTDEARALWKAQGGTEAAWTVWSKPASGGTEQAAEGRWEKPTKAIPVFELSDLSGKTWRLKELGGKTLVINLWATWCGPCMAELPHLEKFYEKVKNRTDIQVLTFDIDEDLGLVAPFMKEKGYTFPVLPAYSTVVSLLDGFAIPQTWLVDQQGSWRWKQIGFGGGSDADFEKDLLGKLDATKAGQ